MQLYIYIHNYTWTAAAPSAEVPGTRHPTVTTPLMQTVYLCGKHYNIYAYICVRVFQVEDTRDSNNISYRWNYQKTIRVWIIIYQVYVNICESRRWIFNQYYYRYYIIVVIIFKLKYVCTLVRRIQSRTYNTWIYNIVDAAYETHYGYKTNNRPKQSGCSRAHKKKVCNWDSNFNQIQFRKKKKKTLQNVYDFEINK